MHIDTLLMLAIIAPIADNKPNILRVLCFFNLVMN